MIKYLLSFKVVFLGESGVGKSSIIKHYENYSLNLHNKSLNTLNSTIGVDYISVKKNCKLDDGNNILVKLAIWDTGGQERFRTICNAYYRNISAAVIVYDTTNSESIKSLKYWVNNIKRFNDNPNLLYLILGNKIDVDKNKYYDQCIDILNKLNIKYFYYDTSVKKNININESMNKLIEDLLTNFIKNNKIKKTLDSIMNIEIDNFSNNNNGVNLFNDQKQFQEKKCC